MAERISNPVLMKMVRDLISEKWHEQFPEDFVKCNTLDKEVYNSTKDFAYHTYIDFLNNIDRALNTNNPDYQINDYVSYGPGGVEFQIQQQQKLLHDIRHCDNIKMWCIDNIGTH